VLAHLDKGVPLDRFKLLAMPAASSAASKGPVENVHRGRGLIIRAGRAEPGMAVRSDYAAGAPRLGLEPRGYVLGQLTRKPGGRTLILHLLNYDHQAPAENVKVRLELNGLVEDMSQWRVKVLSPDTPQPPASLCTGHRRVRPEPDRALYRGDFLAQSRVHDERRFELAFVLRNKLGPICPTAATDSGPRRQSAQGRRPNQLLDGS